MPLVENNLYFWAEVTLANLSDATTETLYLINRESALSPFFNDQARPLIVSIQGIGSEMRLDVPTSVTGSLVLDNTPGSFSYERRLSDLFERKTPVNQQVVFKTKVSTSTEDTISGGETLLTTICSSWQADPSANMLRLELESEPISRRIVTKQITTDAFPLAPQSSIGKTLPVVFGQDVEVRPFAVDQTTTPNTNDYAYATELNTKFVVGGFQTMFARNIFGTYTQLAAHTDFIKALAQHVCRCCAMVECFVGVGLC